MVRYLLGIPKLVYRYGFQQTTIDVMVYLDTEFAGSKATRRSTSGGVAMRGTHLIKSYSQTQSTVCLSSAEAELNENR